jgi:opacity protein-like surface antigen
MRRIVVAMMMAAAAGSAQAADLPDFSDLPVLRGGFRDGLSSGIRSWRGFYIGGQVGYGAADMSFSGTNADLIERALGPNNILIDVASSVAGAHGKVSVRQTTFGGFAGYNGQWDDAVLGVEANYMHGTFNGMSSVAPVPLTYVTPFSDGQYHRIGLNSVRSIAITDMGTIRARAGWAVGSFLPYVFGGVALGRADITSAVVIRDASGPDFLTAAAAAYRPPYTASDAVGSKLLYGYTLGLGTEVSLFGGLFARAEWEYLRFVNAGADININTVRGGLGYRF